MGSDWVRIKRRKVCTRDLRHRVTVYKRDLAEPAFGSTDFDETFTQLDEVWAAIQTTNGKTLFNGTMIEESLTHVLWINHRTDVNSENWIELGDGRRLRILDFEDVDEQHDWLLLACQERGPKDKKANLA